MMTDIDYQILKIIFKKNKARLKHIQEGLFEIKEIKIPLSTINSSLKRLEKKGYVNWVRYSPIRLTNQGSQIAKELIRHAQLLEVFLYSELEISALEAHKQSEKLNLLLSCEMVQKICEKYSHPDKCPCGDEILNSIDCYCAELVEK